MSREQWGNGYQNGFKDGLKAKVSFFDFCVKLYGNEDSPYGDFAYDIQRDSSFPKEEKNPENIQAYLKLCNACTECIETFWDIFKKWKSIQHE